MKSAALTCAVAAAALGFGSLSFAQEHHRGDRDGRYGDRQGYAGRDGRSVERGDSRRAWQDGRSARQPEQRGYVRPPQYGQQYGRQYGPQYGHRPYAQQDQYRHDGGQGHWGARVPQYRRGDHVPYQYRQRHYQVTDWRAQRLYAPPQGYQWVRTDDSGDFLLVAIATGLIANMLLSQ